VLKEIPEDPNLRQQWDALVSLVDRPQVFYTYEWSLAVQRTYHVSFHPLLVLAYDESESLVGVVALAVGQDGKRVTFLCATTGDYCDFVSEREHKPAFVSAVLGELRKQGLDDVTLTNLPADSDTLSAVRKASRQNGYRVYARTAYVCAQVAFSQLEKSKDGKPFAPGLKRLKRFTKAMGSAAPVRSNHIRSWQAMEPILPEFMQAHVARFLEIGRISNIANPIRRRFMAELAKLLGEKDWVVLSRMFAGERAVAWHYGFTYQGSWFWYQPTFDSSVEKHWPGFCLLSQVIQDGIDQGMTMLDLGLGSEAYKAKFANETRETLYVTLYHSMLKHWATAFRDRMAQAVRVRPAVEKIAERLRQGMRAVLARLRRDGTPQTLAWMWKRVLGLVWAREEVVLYEWEYTAGATMQSRGLQLHPVDLGRLAVAAMEYEDDEATLGYLLRSTRRLREGGIEGFVLTSEDGRPLHFAWVAPMNGFFCSELGGALRGSTDSAIVFDCWTPSVARGHGYYTQAIACIADRLRASGSRPWIFSAAGNVASIRGIGKAGFQRRYSMVRHQTLGRQRIEGEPPKFDETPAAEVSARV